MSNIKALQWRYAVKKFDSEKILPEAKIDVLKQAFNLTATSYGLQPIRLVVVKNKGVAKRKGDEPGATFYSISCTGDLY